MSKSEIASQLLEAIERAKPDSRRLMPNTELTQFGFDVSTRMFERNLLKELGLEAHD